MADARFALWQLLNRVVDSSEVDDAVEKILAPQHLDTVVAALLEARGGRNVPAPPGCILVLPPNTDFDGTEFARVAQLTYGAHLVILAESLESLTPAEAALALAEIASASFTAFVDGAPPDGPVWLCNLESGAVGLAEVGHFDLDPPHRPADGGQTLVVRAEGEVLYGGALGNLAWAPAVVPVGTTAAEYVKVNPRG